MDFGIKGRNALVCAASKGLGLGCAMAALAAIGEPWVSFFKPPEMADLLDEAGFSHVEDIDGHAINARWFAGRADGLMTTPRAHYVRARV